MPLLTADKLVKSFGTRRVVDEVSFTVAAGQVLGLLGPNGAGKTTTMRLLYGFLRPASGRILIDGLDLQDDLTSAKRRVGVCTQDDTFDSDFSVRQNLHIAASYFRPRIARLDQRVEELLRRFDLRDYAEHKPDTLSGGYRRRLMIARALINRPKLLFLDEPTTGLDPQARRGLWQLIDELRRDGLGIILTTHYMDEAEYLSDRLVVMQRGRVLIDKPPALVLGDLVGEHVVVLEAERCDASLRDWLVAQGIDAPTQVLEAVHLPLRGSELSAFAAAFPELVYEVRKPNLDDLFVHLSGAPAEGSA